MCTKSWQHMPCLQHYRFFTDEGTVIFLWAWGFSTWHAYITDFSRIDFSRMTAVIFLCEQEGYVCSMWKVSALPIDQAIMSSKLSLSLSKRLQLAGTSPACDPQCGELHIIKEKENIIIHANPSYDVSYGKEEIKCGLSGLCSKLPYLTDCNLLSPRAKQIELGKLIWW